MFFNCKLSWTCTSHQNVLVYIDHTVIDLLSCIPIVPVLHYTNLQSLSAFYQIHHVPRLHPVPVGDHDGVPQEDEGEANGEAVHKYIDLIVINFPFFNHISFPPGWLGQHQLHKAEEK